MDQVFHEIKINTKGQGLYDFTKQTISWLDKQKISNGILNINSLHTSASLIIQENADPDVLYDLKNFFDKLVPMNNNLYKPLVSICIPTYNGEKFIEECMNSIFKQTLPTIQEEIINVMEDLKENKLGQLYNNYSMEKIVNDFFRNKHVANIFKTN